MSESVDRHWFGVERAAMGSGGGDCGSVAEAVAFLSYFRDLPDPRQSGKVMYPLSEVLLLLLATVAGADCIVEIARFGQKKRDLLRRFSGGAAQGVLSSPVVGLGNTAFDALHGIGASLRGDGAFNQKDARAIQGLLPFSNFLPVVWAANAMIGGLPNRDTHKHFNRYRRGSRKELPVFFGTAPAH